MDDQVGKLIEPAPVPFTYTTPGWYVLGAVMLLLILFFMVMVVKYYRLNLYRKHALVQLASIEKTHTNTKAFDNLIYETDLLIKRIAMGRYGRQKVSGLRGRQWIIFINSTWRERSFNTSDEHLLNRAIYQETLPVAENEAQLFVQKAKRWIKKHKRKADAV